ncbi:MAG: hypothetical protein ACFB9M_05870 [Myxococcota bacterium]
MSFPGFDDKDFDAFLPKKWGSNAYTLERRRVKDKLLTACRTALERHSDLGLTRLELQATEDVPSVANGRKVRFLAAYFVRPEKVRATLTEHLHTDLASGSALFQIGIHQQHAHLFVRVDQDGLSVGVQVPVKAEVDRVNVAEKLRLDWAPEELREHLGSTSDVRFGFEGALLPLAQLTDSEVHSIAERAEHEPEDLLAAWRCPRADPLVRSEGIVDEVTERLGGLWLVYRFLAWARDNDHTRVAAAVEKVVEETKDKRRPAGLAAGDRVTILGGLFAGRGGYLAELDGKGKAKVMVGPVSVSVDVADLKPAG